MKQDASKIINDVQTVFLYTLVALLPISILPLPWDYTERGMSIVLLVFAILVIGLELIKIIWSGKFLFLKRSIDILFLCLVIGLIFTTVLSKDENLSLWGYDFRLGHGLVTVLASFLVVFISRGFISRKEYFSKILEAFILGSILSSVLSLLSLLGLNIVSIVPGFTDILPEGLPMSGSPVVMVILNSLSIIVSFVLMKLYKSNKQNSNIWFPVVAIVINILSLIIFSVDVIAFRIVILLVSIWLLTYVLFYIKEGKIILKSVAKDLPLPFIIIALASIMQVDSISKSIVGENLLMAPIRLTTDFTWQIVSQSIMSSLKNAIFGIGLDSFANVFNLFKPSDLRDLDLLFGSNEVLTNLSNAGLLWFVVWIMIGWFTFRDLIKDINANAKREQILLDIASLFIYLTSLFIPFTTLIRFVFFLFYTFNVLYRNIVSPESVDSIILKIWAMGTNKSGNKGENMPIFSIFFTVIIGLTMGILVYSLGRMTYSSLYLIRSESYSINANKLIEGREATEDEREEYIDMMYYYYSQSYKYDPNNTVVNRKLSLISLEKLGVLFNKYEQEKNPQILNEVVALRGDVFDYSRFAFNTSPTVYANSENRAIIYLGLVNLGYTDYLRDAIAVIDEAISLKPLDFINYYYKAQVYTLLEDYEMALNASSQSLSINGSYVPALLLSAQINGIQGNTEIQQSYLVAAKTVLETQGQEGSEIYRRIVEQINTDETEEVLDVQVDFDDLESEEPL